MYCPKCGTLVAENDNFCRKCATPLLVSTEHGTVIEGNVTTGGGNFIGRDFVKRLSMSLNPRGGCVNITIVYASIFLILLFLGTMAYQTPEIQSRARQLVAEFLERIEKERNSSTPELLPTPVPTFTPEPTPPPTSIPATPVVKIFDSKTCNINELLARIQVALAQCSELNKNWVCINRRFDEETNRFLNPDSAGLIRNRVPLEDIETPLYTEANDVIIVSIQNDVSSNPITLLAFSVQEDETLGKTSCFSDVVPGMIIRSTSGKIGRITINGMNFDLAWTNSPVLAQVSTQLPRSFP